ncbi:MAG: hypothetical protein HY646_14525 [Acidobacteria bacterium]|nr:hypothetical protein [Acidobacteriota bacterium]
MDKPDEPFEIIEPTSLPSISVPAALAACAAGWLVPGLSHLLLGRWIRGLIFMACVIGMFMLGIAMEGKLYDLAFEQPLHIFAFIANLGAGLPYLLAEMWEMGIGTMTVNTYDYGTTFLWTAGLLNYLIVLDAFDIARGRKP